MKKIFFTLLILSLSILMVACGSNNEETNADGDSTENVEDSINAEEKEEAKEKEEISDTKFDNGDYVYEIKSVEQITGKYDDKQILAIELSFTNNTEEPKSPWMALGIHAEQETDTTVETLIGANGQFPDDYKPELVEMGDTDIKPGATVDAVIGYEIMYPGSPVTLTNFSMMDEKIFEGIVETE